METKITYKCALLKNADPEIILVANTPITPEDTLSPLEKFYKVHDYAFKKKYLKEIVSSYPKDAERPYTSKYNGKTFITKEHRQMNDELYLEKQTEQLAYLKVGYLQVNIPRKMTIFNKKQLTPPLAREVVTKNQKECQTYADQQLSNSNIPNKIKGIVDLDQAIGDPIKVVSPTKWDYNDYHHMHDDEGDFTDPNAPYTTLSPSERGYYHANIPLEIILFSRQNLAISKIIADAYHQIGAWDAYVPKPILKNLIKVYRIIKSDYEKDLTAEGIEPNPGPFYFPHPTPMIYFLRRITKTNLLNRKKLKNVIYELNMISRTETPTPYILNNKIVSELLAKPVALDINSRMRILCGEEILEICKNYQHSEFREVKVKLNGKDTNLNIVSVQEFERQALLRVLEKEKEEIKVRAQMKEDWSFPADAWIKIFQVVLDNVLLKKEVKLGDIPSCILAALRSIDDAMTFAKFRDVLDKQILSINWTHLEKEGKSFLYYDIHRVATMGYCKKDQPILDQLLSKSYETLVLSLIINQIGVKYERDLIDVEGQMFNMFSKKPTLDLNISDETKKVISNATTDIRSTLDATRDTILLASKSIAEPANNFLKTIEEFKKGCSAVFTTSAISGIISDHIGKILSLCCTLTACIISNQNSVRALLAVSLTAQLGITTPLLNSLTQIISHFSAKIQGKELKVSKQFYSADGHTESKLVPETIIMDFRQPLAKSKPDEKVEVFGQASDGVYENVFLSIKEIFCNALSITDSATKVLDVKRITAIKSYGSLVKTSKDFLEFMFKSCQQVFYWCYESVTGMPYDADAETIYLFKKLKDWIVEVSVLRKMPPKVFIKQSHYRESIKKLHNTGLELKEQLLNKQISNFRLNLFSSTLTEINKLNDSLNDFIRTDQGRVRPVVLYLAGAPNVGKSALVEFLVHDLCQIYGIPYGANAVYNMNFDDDFQSGYDSQLVTVIDDPFQSPEDKDLSKVGMELIKLANDASYNMNMASIEDKGHTFFDSPIIIITCNNIDTLPGLKLQNLNAYKRRRDFVYEVLSDWKPEMKTWQRAYKFQLRDKFYESTKIGEQIDYATMLTKLVETLNERLTNYGNLKKYLKDEQVPDFLTHISKKCGDSLKNFMELKTKPYMESLPPTMIGGSALSDAEYYDAQDGSQDKDKSQPGPRPDLKQEQIKVQGQMLRMKPIPDNIDLDPDFLKYYLSPDHESTQNNDGESNLQKQALRLKNHLKFYKDELLSFCESIHTSGSSAKGVAIITTCIGVLGMLVGGIALYKAFKRENVEVEVESGLGRTQKHEVLRRRGTTPHQTIRKTPIQMSKDTPKVTAQALDASAYTIIDNIIKANTVGLTINDVASVKALFLKDKTFVTVAHIFRFFDCETITITDGDNKFSFKYEDLSILFMEDDDQAYVTIKVKTFQPRKDITNHFISAKDLPAIPLSKVALTIKRSGGGMDVRTSSKQPRLWGELQFLAGAEGGEEIQVLNSNTLLTYVDSVTGDCGSAYVVMNSTLPQKIIGIHCAGGTHAVCTLITKEDLDVIFGTYIGQMSIIDIENIALLPASESKIPLTSLECENVEVIGCVPPNLSTIQPGNTEIRKSALHNKWHKTNYTPAMLRPDRTSGVAPFSVGLAKKLIRPKNTHKDAKMKLIAEWILNKLPYKVEARKLTVQEALNGVRGYKFLKRIDLNTSPGWPRNLQKNKLKGKKSFVTMVGDQIYIIKSVEEQLLRHESLHKQGIRTHPIVCDNLKDELLPSEKVYVVSDEPTHDECEGCKYCTNTEGEKIKWIGNTRIMNSLPFHTLIEERQLTGAFFENLLQFQSEPDSFCDLGIDPSTHEPFLKLFKKLCMKVFGKRNGKRVFRIIAGDLKKMDASIAAELSHWFRWILVEWYRRSPSSFKMTPEELVQLETLDLDLSDVMHLAINVLYRTEGNPSGRCMTTVKNSFIMLFLLILTGINTYLKKVDPNCTDFNSIFQYVYETADVFGDDHILAVDENCWFDMFDVKEECAKWGMEYTGIFKDKPLVPYYDLEECKYLQRFIMEKYGIVHACLDKDIIEDIVYWVKDSQPHDEALVQSVDSALREAFHWGVEYFEMLKHRYNSALIELQIPPVTLDYNMLCANFHKTEYVLVSAESKKRKRYDWTEEQELIHVRAQMSTTADMKIENTSASEATIQTTTFVDQSYQDNTKVETPSFISPAIKDLDPYPPQGMDTVLTRPYVIDETTWSSNDALGARLIIIDPLIGLYAIPNIQEKLNRFQFLQAAVKFVIKLNTTRMNSGKLQINWAPHHKYDAVNSNIYQNIYIASNLNTHILSANTAQTVEFVIPCVMPIAYWNMKDSPSSNKGMFGSVCFWVLAPLTQTGATGIVTTIVTTYANFVEPKLMGLGLRNDVMLLSSVKKLSNYTKENKNKQKPKVIGQSFIKDLTTEGIEPNPGPTQKQEGRVRSQKNSIADLGTATQEIGYSLLKKNFLGPLTEMADSMLGSLGESLFALFLDKPTSTQAPTKIVPRPITSFAHADGLDGCEKLSMHPENRVSTDTSLYCSPYNYSNFLEYKLLPALISLGYFDKNTAVGYKIIEQALAPTIVHNTAIGGGQQFDMTHLANLASYFALYRGGIKIKILYSCSSFTTCRLRHTHLPDPTFTASIVRNEEGDTVNKVLDIVGDTTIELTIPYLNQSQWAEVLPPDVANFNPVTNWEGYIGQFIVTVVNPVLNASELGSSRVYWAMYISGAEDFQVARPTNLWETYEDNTTSPSLPVVEAQNGKEEEVIDVRAQMSIVTDQTDMRAAFRKPFETMVPANTTIPTGLQMGEEITSFLQLLRRYCFLESVIGSSSSIRPYDIAVGQIDKFHRILRTFFFNRGGIRFKSRVKFANSTYRAILAIQNTGMTYDNTDLETGLDCGVTMQDSRLCAFVEAEIPYYTKYAMHGWTFPADQESLSSILLSLNDVEYTTSGNSTLITYIATSDDFTLGFPAVPVPLQIAP